MRKFVAIHGVAIGALLLQSFAFGQSPTPSATSTPAQTPTPPVLTSVVTPTPTPTLTPGPTYTPTPESTPYQASAVNTSSTFQYSEQGAPVYTIDKAVTTALQQNPDVLKALQEIQRSKGVIIEIRAQALPHIGPNANYDWEDPNLHPGFSSSKGGGSIVQNDVTYEIRVTGTQLIFNGTTWPSIRGTFFQRDAAYFSFRNVVDQVVSTVKQQFYQVVVNRALIGVQEESVRLLESQLQDQQNRFEAGTVPRFNVLQAQVQLSNQIPNLIAARNNYRISILQLAKTLGLDYDPRRGVAAPIHVVGELTYIPRRVQLVQAIEEGKQQRALLKEARANVLNQIEQVHVALGGFLPTINTTGGGDWRNIGNESSSWNDIAKGWVAGVTGSWPIWDSGQVYGQVKQQRALLSESKITYDDSVRQVELEIQQAASNLLQNRELIQATEKTVEQADESVRLAKARLDAGAGTQLDVLNAQVQLTTAQSTRLQALFGYIASLAEFDRVTGTQSVFTESFNRIAPHSTRSAIYDTSSGVDATGKRKPASSNPFANDTTTAGQRRPYSK